MARNIDPANCSLLEIVYLRTRSLRKASKVGTFILAWGIARRELGHAPNIDEYAAYWKQPVRTAYREQAAFRDAFPHLDDPAAICDLLDRAEAARESDRLDFTALAA